MIEPELRKRLGVDVSQNRGMPPVEIVDPGGVQAASGRMLEGKAEVSGVWNSIKNKLSEETGAITIEKLSAGERKAIDGLLDQAKQSGKVLGDFLKEQGFDAKAITILESIAQQGKEQLPKYAQSVNLERQNIGENAKQLELAIAKERKPISWEETQTRADKILTSPRSLKKTQKDLADISGGKLTAEIDAMREYNAAAVAPFQEKLNAFSEGKLSGPEFNKWLANYDDALFHLTSDASSEIGRALNIHKRTVSGTRILDSVLKLKEKGLNERQLKLVDDTMEKLRKGELTSEQLERFKVELPDPTAMEYVMEYWYNSILSGPPTHAVNLTGNTLWFMYQPPHRAHVAFWDKTISMFTGKEREFFLNEIVPMLAGYKTGAKRGVKAAGKMFAEGDITEFETKWSQEIGGGNIGAWARSPHKWMREVAPYITPPTKALRAADVFANSVAWDGELMAYATRMGNKQGLKGQKLKEFREQYIKEVGEGKHKDAVEYATKQAKHYTFMDDPDPITGWFLEGRGKKVFGQMSRFVIPFVNTISNLTKRGMELTPGVGLAKEGFARVAWGRKKPIAEIVAKQVEGSILALYLFHKAAKGELTGAPPPSEAEREGMYERGELPWGIKAEDTWIQYRRFEPWNTVLASVAITYDRIQKTEDEKERTALFEDVVVGLKNNLLDSSYLDGLSAVFDRHSKIKERGMKFLSSFVPYSSFWRSINRAYEKLTEGETTVKEKDNILKAFSQVIPGLSDKVPAELTVWGKEKVNIGTIFQHLLPYKWRKESKELVETTFGKLGYWPGKPNQWVTINGKKTKLPDDMYRNYCIDFGHRARVRVEKVLNMPYRQGQVKRLDSDNPEEVEKVKTALLKRLNSVLDSERAKALKRVRREYKNLNK